MTEKIVLEKLPKAIDRYLKGEAENKEIKKIRRQLKAIGYFDSEIDMLFEGNPFKIKKGKIVFDIYKEETLIDVLNRIGSRFIGYKIRSNGEPSKTKFICTCVECGIEMIGQQLYVNEHRTVLCDDHLKEFKKRLFLEYRRNRRKEKKAIEELELLADKGQGHLNVKRKKKKVVSLSLPGSIYLVLEKESSQSDDLNISDVGILWLRAYYETFIKNQGPVKSFVNVFKKEKTFEKRIEEINQSIESSTTYKRERGRISTGEEFFKVTWSIDADLFEAMVLERNFINRYFCLYRTIENVNPIIYRWLRYYQDNLKNLL
jgi:hypothetical protein